MQPMYPPAVGLAMGLFWALSLGLLGVMAALFGYGVEWVSFLGGVYLGYNPSWLGILMGMLWGFVDGWIAGALYAWIYNRVSGRWMRS